MGMGTLGRTWDLYKRSFDVLCADAEIILFPIMSAFSAIVLAAGFFFPLSRTGVLKSLGDRTAGWDIYAIMFAWYYLHYFIIIFFNSALVGCANIRLSGGNPNVRDGLRIAVRHWKRIASWTLLASTIGLILDSLRGRGSRMITKLLLAGAGLAWNLVTYLIVPVIVLEDRTAYGSMERSAELFKKRWGEGVAGSFGFGVLNLLLLVPGLLLAWLLFTLDRALAVITVIWYIVILAAISSAVKGIFTVVLYRYASSGDLPYGFSDRLIDSALGQKVERDGLRWPPEMQ
jgi:hypothetical protein